MAIRITQLGQHFVGEVEGIDLSRPVTPEQAKQIEAGMDRYGVLVFHDQQITDEQQMDFSRNFGELEVSSQGEMSKPGELRLAVQMADVSNLDRDNRVRARDDAKRLGALGNRLWHSDASFRAIPARYSLLSARVVPGSGGNTEFADMRAAYDALDADTKAEVAELITEHSIAFSRAELGFDAFPAEHQDKLRPVRHRLVTVHPGSGRRVLYLSAHIGSILGWPVPEARAFIRDLMEHATQPEFVYAHVWRVGDLVMWDNRATMHRVRRYADMQVVRDLRRTTTRCDGPTTEQVLAAE
jgi:alpha-ketoglutarate-dependent 2,4-dichlorophenoxyacetate dioxygenase